MTARSSKAFSVSWRDLARWDIKSARAAVFRVAHPSFRPLGEFAEEVTELVRPFEKPDKEWPVYGVNNIEGVFLSHKQLGAEFNAPYKRIEKDWFFHNPTRANVGSLGRVPDVPPDAITSPEYQVWRIKQGLTPDFVELLIQTRFFLDLVECHRVGAVKERLFVQNLLEIPIPVVSPSNQNHIIAHWQKKQAEVDTIVRRAEQRRAEIEGRFLNDLGIANRALLPMPKIVSVKWGQLIRWSAALTFNSLMGQDKPPPGRYEYTPLGVVASISYGIQKSPANRPGVHARPYLRVANVRRGYLDLSEVKTINVPDADMHAFRLESGDLLFVEGNGSRSELGRVALWQAEIEDCVHQNHLIKARVNKFMLLPEFAMAWFNTEVGRGHFFRSAKSASGLGTINSNEVRSAPIPLPPRPAQEKIISRLQEGYAQVKDLLAQAEQMSSDAKLDIEALLLGDGKAQPSQNRIGHP